MSIGESRRIRWILAIAVLEIVNASYLAAFDTPSIFYHVNVVLHVLLGIPLAAAILFRSVPALLKSAGRSGGPQGLLLRTLAVLAAVFVGSGLLLAYTGTARRWEPLLKLHVFSAIAGGGLLLVIVWAWSRRPSADDKSRSVFRWNFAVLLIALVFPLAVRGYEQVDPPHVVRIVNPELPPLTPFEEGAGEGTSFFPSSNETVGAKLLPSDFFLDSRKACGSSGCHPDITDQWEGSMHHFSSFNNQWYRKAVEYMQDTVGTSPSKWCGGCHDMAILLTGRMDTPIREQIDTAEAQAGIGCLVCHSISHVKDTMGQGSFVLEYPEMHKLAASEAPLMKMLHDYMTRLDPDPHRQTMLKPFHRESTPEFCSSCHKVHLDVPVNSYRWFRGFNEYDGWQVSGVSGQGARSFYYPPTPQDCADCHMPLTASDDAGNIDGYVHSHRFPAANTAVPFANQDEAQLEATTKFLKSGIVSVDIFGIAEAPELEPSGDGPQGKPAAGEISHEVASMVAREDPFSGAVGGGRSSAVTRAGRLMAPLETGPDGTTRLTLRRGREYVLEVVARTRTVGHMFPGGTIDSFDVWIELKGEDENGNVVFWSGWVEPEPGAAAGPGARKGPVEKNAHFYRAMLLDGHGNPINKRNAYAARAVMYARQIPPGAADTIHYRIRLPEDCGERVTFTAKINYRKFSWWNTQWAYAGVRDPQDTAYEVTAHYDDGAWIFTGDTSTVSGKLKEIPDLPITELAQDMKVFLVAEGTQDLPEDPPGAAVGDIAARGRYNDYGIGLLLQGDLRGALEAFRSVTRIDPQYADGYVNMARALIQQGSHAEAKSVLEQALEIDPDLAKTHYFYSLTLKTTGQYEEAADHLIQALEKYPRDKAVLNQLGRVRFLQRHYDDAIATFKRTLAVDPEDLQAHYNMMLSYRGMGREDDARLHETYYKRFKADESSQEITGPRRRNHPEENNERLTVHEHVSTWPPRTGGAVEEYQGQ